MRTRAVVVSFSIWMGCSGAPESLEQGILYKPKPGEENQGRSLDGHAGLRIESVDLGAKMSGVPVTGVHIEEGELVGLKNGQVVRGSAWAGAFMTGHDVNGARIPLWVQSATLGTNVPSTHPEWVVDASGSTYVYNVYKNVGGEWTPLCKPNVEQRIGAIPVAALWPDGQRGDRVESATDFTFSCLSGVITKCYRWGYRPWLSSPDASYPMKDLHQACTRAARADYCGDGNPHTLENTPVNIFDDLVPVKVDDVTDLLFEAGWTNNGASCLSHLRWENFPPDTCSPQLKRGPYTFGPSFAGGWLRTPNVCNTPAETPNSVRLFIESNINELPSLQIIPINPILVPSN
jgi:hypothetical protein